MTLLDLLIAIPLGVMIYIGWKRGAVREAAALVGVLIGIWAAVHFSRLIALMLGLRGEDSILIAFFIVFVGTLVLANLLGRTADRVIKALKMNLPNKIAGAALGMMKAVCILSVALSGMVMIDTDKSLISQETRDKSLLYSPVCSTGNELISSLKEFVENRPELSGENEKLKNENGKMKEQKAAKKEATKTDKKGGRK